MALQVVVPYTLRKRFNALTLCIMKENKKLYSFRFSRKTNNQLSNLASQYHRDRTEMLEYMIDVWAGMWNDNGDEKCENDTTA